MQIFLLLWFLCKTVIIFNFSNFLLKFIINKNINSLFLSSSLKNKIILEIYIFPPETSYICLTILIQIYSKSVDKIGEEIES